jgi:hypothetical protein
VYVSDGGHFENLGVYELVRRKCMLIIACDASEDSHLTFRSIGNAIERCRVDFGVEISIDISAMVAGEAGSYARKSWSWGRIRYTDDPAGDGILLYIKARLTGSEPIDLVSYAATHTGFPNESTTNQWFTESQFESYRRLGQHVSASALRELNEALESGLFGDVVRSALQTKCP